MDNVIEIIQNLKTEILAKVTNKLLLVAELDSYEIAWKQMQDIAAKEVEVIIKNNIPDCEIIFPKSKSEYPDIKIKLSSKFYAIDIKCAEIQKNPWFDMARMDTFKKSRLDVYEEEWELILQYDSKLKKFLKAFFGLFREFVGKHSKIDGIKFRPYDGKIRPKTWEEFDNNIIYWNSKEVFLQNLRTSQLARWKSNISQHLIPLLNDKEKTDFANLFFNEDIEVIHLKDNEE